jgi:predicted Rossmann-fold nucleotide-binding protein
VYGGAKVGVMGVIADSVLAAGGEVIGVIPNRLMTRELAHPGPERAARGGLHARPQA